MVPERVETTPEIADPVSSGMPGGKRMIFGVDGPIAALDSHVGLLSTAVGWFVRQSMHAGSGLPPPAHIHCERISRCTIRFRRTVCRDSGIRRAPQDCPAPRLDIFNGLSRQCRGFAVHRNGIWFVVREYQHRQARCARRRRRDLHMSAPKCRHEGAETKCT